MFLRISPGLLSLALVGLLALTACQSGSSSSDKDPVKTTLASAKKVSLDSMEPDAVSPGDVINRSKGQVNRTGEIYMMRGLANVFSRGIDDMARQLRSQGYDAANFAYGQWQPIAQDIVARGKRKRVSYPVVIVGHSLGGNESSKFANYLASNGVNVGLVVAFDPIERGTVVKGVGRVVNYYLPKEKDVRIGASAKSEDNLIHPSEGFNGDIKNVDVSVDPSITHVNVDKHEPYQQATIKSIANITRKLRKTVITDRNANSR